MSHLDELEHGTGTLLWRRRVPTGSSHFEARRRARLISSHRANEPEPRLRSAVIGPLTFGRISTVSFGPRWARPRVGFDTPLLATMRRVIF